MKRLRVGLIGAGRAAARHVRVLTEFDDVVVGAVADPIVERARELAGSVGGRAYPSYQELLEREALDAVFVCVPAFAHGQPEIAVAEAGLPMYVELPLAPDTATAERVAGVVAAAGVPAAAGHHWRYLDTLERAADLLDGRAVALAMLYWLDRLPGESWRRRMELSGGQVVSQVIHLLDAARVLVGEFASVSSRTVGGIEDEPGTDVERAGAATLRFRNGAIGTLTYTSLLSGLQGAGIAVFAEGLGLQLSETELVVDAGDGPAPLPARGSAVARLDRDFLDVVLGHRERTRADYAEALATHRVAAALLRSADQSRTITLAKGFRRSRGDAGAA